MVSSMRRDYLFGNIANNRRDEHYSRSPTCPFFLLLEEHKQNGTAKNSKSKKGRSSKLSRLSTQSSFTVTSEAPSFADVTMDEQDSVLTTVTTASTAQGGKKTAKGKRATATKGRKTRSKKTDPVDTASPEPESVDVDAEVEKENKKTKNGRKRKSDEATELNVSVMGEEGPALKRRATRTRGSLAVNNNASNIQPEDHAEEQTGTASRRGRSSTTKLSRKASTKKASINSAIPKDEEIDQALEADLERQLTDNEDATAASLKKSTRSTKATKSDYEMFNPEPVEVDEAAIDAELEAIEPESKPLPKTRGGKAKTTRKASAKQQAIAAKKAAEAEPETAAENVDQNPQNLPEPETDQKQPKGRRTASQKLQQQATGKNTKKSVLSAPDQTESPDDGDGNDVEMNDAPGPESDTSILSQATVIKGVPSHHESPLEWDPISQVDEGLQTDEPAKMPEEPSASADTHSLQAYPEEGAPLTDSDHGPELEKEGALNIPASNATKSPKPRGRSSKSVEAAASPVSRATVEALRSPSPTPKETTPSQSPQSSDAENRPPSSRPSMAKKLTPPPVARTPLGAKTPTMSPSKRNIISGLQTTQPWSAVDLDTFLRSPEKKGLGIFDNQVESLKKGELTSPEKRMTVEEWIYHNAELAEEKLRNDCERMVGDFEREGGRAMRALEGIICRE